MRFSIVIPVFNEEHVLPELLRRIAATLDGIAGGPHELLLIDDGSSDQTRAMLAVAAAVDSRVRVILLSRNFGHQAAITAGLDHARGDVIAVMDGDLQDQPEDLPQLLAALHEGYDVVYAIRTLRKEGLVLRACYFLYYRLLSGSARLHVPVDAGDFAVMTRRVLIAIRSAPERNRYVRGLRAWAGYAQRGVEVQRAARAAGQSKYSYRALLRLGLDGLFAFSIMPIRAAMGFGACGVAAATLYAVWAVFERLFLHRSPQGFTATILIVTFLSGVNLFFLGVVGEYVGRVYEEVKARPAYVIESMLGEP